MSEPRGTERLDRWKLVNQYLRQAVYTVWYIIALIIGFVGLYLGTAVIRGATAAFVDYLTQVPVILA